MKNFKLLLATAVVFAVGSAFTAAQNESKFDGEYILNGDTWQPKGDGECISSSNVCDYIKTGSATTAQYPNENQNPANFQANRTGTYVE